MLHMGQERWDEAAEALSGLKEHDADSQLRLRLCRNLAAMREHRPEIYREIAVADFGEQLQLISGAGGYATIGIRTPDGQLTSLSANNDPIATLLAVLQQLKDLLEKGGPLALAGIGDGYLLNKLASINIDHYLGRQQAIYLFEPDPRMVLACCMIHDFTGADGPIAQQRFRWYVGEQWFTSFRQDYFRDLLLPFPTVTASIGLASRQVREQLATLLPDIAQLDAQNARVIDEHYRSITRDDLVTLLGSNGPRRPRVMLITTIFSTVLKFSTRDTADAFAQLGWETHVHIEPTLYHYPSRLALRADIARFKPDLIFQIDHLRHEHQDLIPPNVPFVCWVQDNLPNLTDRAAAAMVNSREFVLIPSMQRYVRQYGYPQRQCMEFRKLARHVDRPASWSNDGDDFVYVSNWSKTPEIVTQELVKDFSPLAPPQLIEECCRRIAAVYGEGKSLATPGEVRRVYQQVCREMQIRTASTELELAIVNQLFERTNNCLYRQQSLTWVVDLAKQLGLSLAIYGRGWESHPQFAPHARGVIEYGPKLEDVTRRAKINLVLEPYVCIAHQRLLDGLIAGGFFLIRSSPYNQMLQDLIDCLQDHEPDRLCDAASAIASMTQDQRMRLSRVLERCSDADATPDAFDPVTTTRDLQRAGFVPQRGPLLPRLDEVAFDSPQQLAERVRLALHDESHRRAISSAQRSAVERRFLYVAGIRRMIDFILHRITHEDCDHHAINCPTPAASPACHAAAA